MKTMNNQVTRLRDEITGKELALAKDQQEYLRLEKDNEALKVLLSDSVVQQDDLDLAHLVTLL